MQIVVLGGFAAVLVAIQMPLSSAPAWRVALLVAAYLGGVAALGRLNSSVVMRRLGRHARLGLLANLWLVGGPGAIVLLGYGHWLANDLHLSSVPLAKTLAALAPFVLGLWITWYIEHPLHVALLTRNTPPGARPVVWTRRQYLAYNTRHHLLFIAVPVCLIVLLAEGMALYLAPRLPDNAFRQDVLFGATAVAAAGVFFFAPVLIVRIWRTRRMDDGPLRRRLESMCRRMRLRYRQLLIWDSGGVIANAGVMGLAAPVRYVLLSDGLLESMDPGQIEAVFAHEAGHIASHHIFYSAMFMVSAISLTALVIDRLAVPLGLNYWQVGAIKMSASAALLLAAFGWLSRRFERQSDVIAAWACSPNGGADDGAIDPEGAAVFASALQRIAQLNGVEAHKWNWRHGSIADRISYVLCLGSPGGSRKNIDRLVRRIRVGIWALALLAAGAGAWDLLTRGL